MCRVMPRLLGTIVLVGLFAVPAASDTVNVSELIYSPWTKFCFAHICFTALDGHSKAGCPLVSAALVEQDGDPKETLRVTLPNTVRLENGVRIAIDQTRSIAMSYTGAAIAFAARITKPARNWLINSSRGTL
jgi:invasion protein IalB